jgi:hypothetical protein
MELKDDESLDEGTSKGAEDDFVKTLEEDLVTDYDNVSTQSIQENSIDPLKLSEELNDHRSAASEDPTDVPGAEDNFLAVDDLVSDSNFEQFSDEADNYEESSVAESGEEFSSAEATTRG